MPLFWGLGQPLKFFFSPAVNRTENSAYIEIDSADNVSIIIICTALP